MRTSERASERCGERLLEAEEDLRRADGAGAPCGPRKRGLLPETDDRAEESREVDPDLLARGVASRVASEQRGADPVSVGAGLRDGQHLELGGLERAQRRA